MTDERGDIEGMERELEVNRLFAQGQDAAMTDNENRRCKRYKPQSVNPYTKGTAQHEIWERGYRFADQHSGW